MEKEKKTEALQVKVTKKTKKEFKQELAEQETNATEFINKTIQKFIDKPKETLEFIQ